VFINSELGVESVKARDRRGLCVTRQQCLRSRRSAVVKCSSDFIQSVSLAISRSGQRS